MAHFVKLNDSNEVVKVTVVPNDECPNDTEEEGIAYLNKTFSVTNVIWKKCSYNTQEGSHELGGTPPGGNYPGVGWIYDDVNDIFITQKPHPSFVLNVAKAKWEAPVTSPTPEQCKGGAEVGKLLLDWDEANQRWTAYDSANASEGQDLTATQKYAWNPSTEAWDEI